MLNLSIYVFFDILASCFMLYMAVILLYNAHKRKYKHLSYFGWTWFSVSLCNFLFAFANMLNDLELFLFARNLVPFEVFCSIIFVDFVSRESLDIKKMFPLTILSGFLWSSSLDTDILYIGTYANGSTSILTQPGMFAVSFNLLSIYWSAILLYFVIRLYWEASAKMRVYSKWNIFACVLITIRGVFFYEIDSFLPGITFLMMCLSVLIMSNNFLSHPQLAFILPFRILRIAVVDTRSGLELFSHNWQVHKNSEIMSDLIFSNVIHGINIIMQEMVQKGHIHEIHMEQGVVILEHIPNSPFAFLLVTTKTSKILRNALSKFSEMFVQQFSDELEKVSNIQQFSFAKVFLDACFPFIPDYM